MTYYRQLSLPGEIVKKSNALVRAYWSVKSVWEPRLVALVASKVRVDDQDFQTYEIPISEVLRDHDGGTAHRELERAVHNLMGRVLTIKEPNGWAKCQIFSLCRFKEKENVLELRFDPTLKPHYLNLQERFAKWNLIEHWMLSSFYSQRIFEILKSWDDQPEVIISLIELHEMLDVPKALRIFSAFRRRVLEQAQKEITKNTELRFTWEPVKKGKAVVAIRFIFDFRR